MFDFIQLLYDLRHKPSSFVGLAVIIFIADRLFRNLITHQVKKLFNVQEKNTLAAYEARQIHIENMVEELLRKEGIPFETRHIVELPKRSTVKNLKILLISLWDAMKRRVKRMGNINKAVLLPLFSAIALLAKELYGYEISNEQINMYVELALYIIAFIGIFIKPRKEVKKDDELEFDTDASA